MVTDLKFRTNSLKNHYLFYIKVTEFLASKISLSYSLVV